MNFHFTKKILKKIKIIEDKGENKINAIENYGKQLAETYIFHKKDDFDIYDNGKIWCMIFIIVIKCSLF